jgi:hypothetical protein
MIPARNDNRIDAVITIPIRRWQTRAKKPEEHKFFRPTF